MHIKQTLFDAFRQDHAVLGATLHQLRSAVTAGQADKAKALCTRLDQESGAHIAFEEHDFYPALRRFLSEEEVTQMYADHERGLSLIDAVLAIEGSKLDDKIAGDLIEKIDDLEKHVSECGELFGAMGGLSKDEQARLLERLEHWRQNAPTWHDASSERMSVPMPSNSG